MPTLLHHFIQIQASIATEACALCHRNQEVSYGQLLSQVEAVATGLQAEGLMAGERVGIYLPKLPETVYSLFGTSLAGGVFVPINPLLKPAQVQHILKDCKIRVLISCSDRLQLLAEILPSCTDLQVTICIDMGQADSNTATDQSDNLKYLRWTELIAPKAIPLKQNVSDLKPERIDTDVVAILYTSGSTGKPKGVVLSHRNMVAGAESVASYLHNTPADRLLAVLPFSFDYGLSQLTCAFHVGASVVLMDYLLPRDVIRAISRYQITGLAAVPPLWNQLASLSWPAEAQQSLRYITNSGGAMPESTTHKLRTALPQTDLFLMYGLTEAFRSTYLPPEQVSHRPDSMGKAIPNAEVLIVREDGSECDVDEIGELVHRGSLVAMGYWNDPEKTTTRFKPAPQQNPALPITELAVWSGDQARKDADGYLYFVGRKDEMIKTSGYRVSPTEVEEVLYQSQQVQEAAAIGVPHPMLGQAILLIVKTSDTDNPGPQIKKQLMNHCRQTLPNFMQPQDVIFSGQLPRNPNGKIDRKQLTDEFAAFFSESNP